jgi:hypothetical protein
MRNALYVEEEIFFSGYVRLFCNGRPHNFGGQCHKNGQGTPSLILRQIVWSCAYKVSLFSKENRNLFTRCTAIVRLRSGYPTILWQRATPVIVGWFGGCWKILKSGVPSRLHFCVIFTVYTPFTNVAPSCITQPGGPDVGDPWSKNNAKLHWYIVHTFSKRNISSFYTS